VEIESPPIHNHGHDRNGKASWGTRLFVSMVMNLIIPIIQIIAGILAGSVALISDAIHNLSDFVSLLISYMALKIGRR
jgi:cobalt-zinc-cadmium efflux system protein